MPQSLPTAEELYRAMGRMVVRFYGRMPGSDCVLASHAILGCSGLGSVFLNCGVVFGDGARGEDPAEQRLREFVSLIRGREAGGYVCLSEPLERRLAPLASHLGLEPLPPIPLMARDATRMTGRSRAPGPTYGVPAADPDAPGDAGAGCVLERVTTEEGLAGLLSVSEAAFGLPSDLYAQVVTPDLARDPAVHLYLLRREGRAVSCVCVVEEEGLAGVSGMATLPGLQGRGIGSGLLSAVLEEHAPRTRAFYLTASAAGQALYRRHGFVTVDAATAWVVPPLRPANRRAPS